jgi:hypothetical protein
MIKDASLPYAVFLGLLVVGSVAAGLTLIDSPAHARLQKMDEARVQDLQTIMNAVENYQRQYNHMPEGLELLRQPGLYPTPPVSDMSGRVYDYSVQDAASYQLCAQFDMATDEKRANLTLDIWKHDAGRFCFHLTVKPLPAR